MLPPTRERLLVISCIGVCLLGTANVRAQSAVVTYDAFMQLTQNERLDKFQSLTPANRADLQREQGERWRRLHADRLTPEQNQFLTDLNEFVQADMERHPPRSNDVIKQFLALEEKNNRLFTRDEQLEQSALRGPYLPQQ